jgi:hypothetical protein
MLDLETLGTFPGCAVLAVGAVLFEVDPFKLDDPYIELDRFYRTVDLKDSVNRGFRIEPETLMWWLREDNRAALGDQFLDPQPLNEVLTDFARFFLSTERTCPEGNPFVTGEVQTIWSCGASFDLPILGWCYRAFGSPIPWTHKHERCHRTMRELFGVGLEPAQVGTTHNAADDAEFQARHLARILFCHLNAADLAPDLDQENGDPAS